MATDAAGHTTPGASDAPKRAAVLDLSLSIRDPIPVADASARSAALSALAGSTPAVTPSSSRPVFFHQADLPKPYRTIWTQDGTNFISTSGHYVWDDATARAAATGAAAGDLGVQLDTKVIYRYDGAAWRAWESDWISYSPTIANVAVGTGGSAASVFDYRYDQGRVKVRFKLVLGTSGASMGTTPTFTLPVAAKAVDHAYQTYASDGDMFDSSANAARLLKVFADAASTTVVRVAYLNNISGLYDYPTASTPWASWGAGDTIRGELVYDQA
jgi:hypothetical protein